MEFERSIRRHAVPLTNFFGALNPTDGGNSQRYSLQAEWHRQDENSETKITAYGFYYDLDLFSDFTYFLTDPIAATSSSSRTGAGWADWTRATRFSASGLAATWKIHSACKSATTGSTTAFTRPKTACAWTNWIRPPAPFARHHAEADVNDLRTRKSAFMRKTKSSGGKFRSVAGPARRPGLL
jgi:hypothetical protein